jgi:uncharacterized protein involved in outer membrane biogenesis
VGRALESATTNTAGPTSAARSARRRRAGRAHDRASTWQAPTWLQQTRATPQVARTSCPSSSSVPVRRKPITARDDALQRESHRRNREHRPCARPRPEKSTRGRPTARLSQSLGTPAKHSDRLESKASSSRRTRAITASATGTWACTGARRCSRASCQTTCGRTSRASRLIRMCRHGNSTR